MLIHCCPGRDGLTFRTLIVQYLWGAAPGGRANSRDRRRRLILRATEGFAIAPASADRQIVLSGIPPHRERVCFDVRIAEEPVQWLVSRILGLPAAGRADRSSIRPFFGTRPAQRARRPSATNSRNIGASIRVFFFNQIGPTSSVDFKSTWRFSILGWYL